MNQRIILPGLAISVCVQLTVAQLPGTQKVSEERGGPFQHFPAVVFLSDSTFLIAWWDERRGNEVWSHRYNEIWAQRYSLAGLKIGENFPLVENVRRPNFSSWFRIAANRSGEFAVVWIASVPGYHGSTVNARKFRTDGSPSTPLVPVSYDVSGENREPSIILNDDGTFSVVWRKLTSSYAGARTDICHRRFLATGDTASPQDVWSTFEPPRYFQDVAASASGNGDIVVAWSVYDSLCVEKRSPSGELIWGPLLLSQPDRFVYTFDMDVNATGTTAISWYLYDEPWECYVQTVESMGSPTFDPVLLRDLSGTFSFWSRQPSVRIADDGSVIAAWTEPGLASGEVYAQRINNDGTRPTAKRRCSPANDSDDPSASWLGANPVVAWMGRQRGQNDIYMALYDTSLSTELMPESLVNDEVDDGIQRDPQIAVGDDGRFVVLWADAGAAQYSQRYLAYMQRFNAEGQAVRGNTVAVDMGGPNYVGSLALTPGGAITVGLQSGPYARVMSILDFHSDSMVGPIVLSRGFGDTGGDFPVFFPRTDNSFFAAWSDRLSPFQGEGAGVFLQRFSTTGDSVGPRVVVNDDTAAVPRLYVGIAGCEDGRFVVGWIDAREGRNNVYGQFFDSTGRALDSNFRVSTDSIEGVPSSPWRASVGFDTLNTAHFAWMQRVRGVDQIILRRWRLGIGPLNSPSILPRTPSLDTVYSLGLSTDSDGRTVIVWSSPTAPTMSTIGQRVDADGNRVGGNFRIFARQNSKNTSDPVVAIRAGKIYLAWADDGEAEYEGPTDIFAARLDFEDPLLTVGPETSFSPETIRLHQNYPNPFNGTTVITFENPVAREVTLSLFNPLGQRIAVLLEGQVPEGLHKIRWDATHLPTGVYFYRLTAGNLSQSKKAVLIR